MVALDVGPTATLTIAPMTTTDEPPATLDLPLHHDLAYRQWIAHRTMTREEWIRQRIISKRLAYQPTFSIITAVYDPAPSAFRQLFDSIRNQSYPFWQHCLVDDGSREAWVVPYLERRSAADSRVTFRARAENGGIVAASNDALRLAIGEFVCLVDHDDVIEPHALFALASLLNERPDTDMIYSDYDVLDRRGRRFEPLWKPDWSPERLEEINFVAHLDAYRRDLAIAVGAFRDGLDGAQDYDLAFRVTERTDRIRHIPDVLYHWRMGETSVVNNPSAKPYAMPAICRAICDHFERIGVQSDIGTAIPAARRQCRRLPSTGPRASVILGLPGSPTAPATWSDKEIERCLTSLAHLTDYDPLQLIVVAPRSIANALDIVSRIAARWDASVVAYDGDWDYGRVMNLGAAHADGETLTFIDELLEAAYDDWLSALIVHAARPAIGAVGPKIWAENGTVAHAGILLANGLPRPVNPGASASMLGHLFSLAADGNYSAVSGACVTTSRERFQEVGGFAVAAEVGYSDVDYCLRVRERGYRVVFTPHAELRQIGSPLPSDRGSEPADELFRARWPGLPARDPYYNPNLRTEPADFQVSLVGASRGSHLA